MQDFAEGTSSRSSKLIHGGLRYLETYDFKLVRDALLEREILMARRRIWSGRCGWCCPMSRASGRAG